MYSLYFSFIFLIFTTVFVFARCDGDFTEVLEADGTCGSKPIMTQVLRSIVCVPRDTLVPLIPKPGQTFYPPVVSVKRCAGYTGNFTCVPTNEKSIRMKRIPVKFTPLGINDSQAECRVVKVEEHIRCKQACSIKETDCKTGQTYEEENCKCVCTDQVQRDKCNRLAKRTWNEGNCQCECHNKQECTTGWTWNEEFCKCL